jgi:hypothetical protein
MRTLITSIVCSIIVLAYIIYFIVETIGSTDRKMTKWDLFMFLVAILNLAMVIGMNLGDLLNEICQ